MSSSPKDIFSWPDGEWCYRSDLAAHASKAESEAAVFVEGTPEWHTFAAWQDPDYKRPPATWKGGGVAAFFPEPGAPFAPPHGRDPVPSILQEIAAKRRRQVEVEGYTREHDDGHADGSLARAAAAYAYAGSWSDDLRAHYGAASFVWLGEATEIARLWPWDREQFQPKSRREDLIEAAAFLVAEIERMDREAASQARG